MPTSLEDSDENDEPHDCFRRHNTLPIGFDSPDSSFQALVVDPLRTKKSGVTNVSVAGVAPRGPSNCDNIVYMYGLDWRGPAEVVADTVLVGWYSDHSGANSLQRTKRQVQTDETATNFRSKTCLVQLKKTVAVVAAAYADCIVRIACTSCYGLEGFLLQ